jgi:hypothetical protein
VRASHIAATIDHPNIIPIYDAGEADGLLYIAMRFVQGPDLKEILKRGTVARAAEGGAQRAGRDGAARRPSKAADLCASCAVKIPGENVARHGRKPSKAIA